MSKSEVYVNVGKYRHNYDDYEGSSLYQREYNFDNGSISMGLSTDCCDHWEENDDAGEGITKLLGKKYKKETISGMNYKNIIYLVIESNDNEESGSVTMYSKKHYCKIEYTHHHNGYYPASFLYYTTFEQSDKSDEEFNSDSESE